MNTHRFEIRENGWIEIEDQALETGPNEVETPSRVNGASHGTEGRFLSGTSRAVSRRASRTTSARQFVEIVLDIVSRILADDERTTVHR